MTTLTRYLLNKFCEVNMQILMHFVREKVISITRYYDDSLVVYSTNKCKKKLQIPTSRSI